MPERGSGVKAIQNVNRPRMSGFLWVGNDTIPLRFDMKLWSGT